MLFYELYKLSKRRLIVLLVGLLLIISSGLYIHSEYNKHDYLINNRGVYEKIEQKVQVFSLEEGENYVVSMVKELDDYDMLSLESVFSGIDPFWGEQIEELKEDNPEVVKRYMSSHYVDDEEALYLDTALFNELNDQFQALKNHQQYIDEMEEYASNSLSASIFHEDNSFSYRNIHKTLADFAPLKTINYQIGLQHGVVSPTQFKPTDIFVIISLFIIIFYLFHYERENGLLRLIYSTKRGKLLTGTMKLTVLTALTFALTFIFHGVILLIGYKLYGFGDLDRYIQSMSAFKTSANILTTGQYLTAYLIFKACATIIIALFIALLFTLFRHPMPVFLLLVTTIGVSFSLYTWLNPNSFMNSLKYINVVALLDVFDLIADYRNINVFGAPISRTSLSYIVGILLMIGLFVLTSISFTLQWGFPWGISFEKLKSKISREQFKWRKFNVIPQHEWYKLLVSGKGWIVIIISIGLFTQMFNVPDKYYMVNEAKYTEYISQLTGPLDLEKTEFIESESLRFENLLQEESDIQEAFEKDLISESEYYDQLIELSNLELAYSAFQIVVEQFDYLVMQKEFTGQNVSFVNNITSDELFYQSKRDILLAITFLILLGILLSTLFTRDYRNNAIDLLRTTKYGRGRLLIQQLIIGYIVAVSLLLIVYVPKYVILFQKFPSLDWSAPIQSVQLFSELPWSVSIVQYVGLVSLLKLAACILIVHIMKLISIIVKKQTLSLLLHCTIFIVPLLIAYLGFKQINQYTFNVFFLGSFVLNGENATYLTIAYVVSMALIGMLVTAIIWKRYISSTSRKE